MGGIVAALRAGSEETIRNLVATIQSGVDLPQVAAHVRNAVRSDPAVQNAYDELSFHIDGSRDLPPAASILNQSSPESLSDATAARDDSRLALPDVRSNASSESTREVQQQFSEPFVRVPAKPWTTVIDDDHLVSHLVSLWLTWMHPWWQWIDKDNFIEAMQQKDISNPLCTSCLVNMILADACVSFPDIPCYVPF